jgi:hypothetical protein
MFRDILDVLLIVDKADDPHAAPALWKNNGLTFCRFSEST